MFVITYQGNVILGPMPWRKAFFESTILDDCEVTVTLPTTNDGAYVVNGDIQILPARYTEEAFNPLVEKLNGPFWTITAGADAVGAWTKMDRTVGEVKGALIDQIAAVRWRKETGGILVNLSGTDYTVETDRVTRSIFLQASQLGADGNTWKFNEGWVTLSAANLTTIVAAIFTHVQTVFTEEGTRRAAIDACTTLTELEPLFATYSS